MLRKTLAAGLAGFSMMVLAAAPALAKSWTLIAEHSVGRYPDRDVFELDPDLGRFDALKFRVTRNRLAVADVKVVYANGTSEHLNVKEHILPGEQTRAYDLAGTHRRINRIEVLYQTEGQASDGRGRMEIFGLKDDSAGGGPQAGWQALGMQSVGFVVDHDTVVVGADKGRFRRIMLKVDGHDIHLYDLRVRFLNGEVQDIPVKSTLRAGESTGVLDLNGDSRTIDRVDMVYRTKPGFYGQAQVTVLGRH